MNPAVPIIGVAALLLAAGGKGGASKSDDFDETPADIPDPDDPSKPWRPTEHETLGDWGDVGDFGDVVVVDDHPPVFGNPHDGLILADYMRLANAMKLRKKSVVVTLSPGQAAFGIGSHQHTITLYEGALRALTRGEPIRVYTSMNDDHQHAVRIGVHE